MCHQPEQAKSIWTNFRVDSVSRLNFFEILQSKYPYSVRIWENTGMINLRIRTFFKQCLSRPVVLSGAHFMMNFKK